MLWPLAAWVCIFGASGSPWAAFWEVLVSLGLHYGSSGGPFGIVGSLVAFGAPWAAWQCLSATAGAQEQIFPLFSGSFWMHFGSFLDLKIDAKNNKKLDATLM